MRVLENENRSRVDERRDASLSPAFGLAGPLLMHLLALLRLLDLAGMTPDRLAGHRRRRRQGRKCN